MTSVEISCPECGESAKVGLTPTFKLSYRASINVSNIDCSGCGYEGPPE